MGQTYGIEILEAMQKPVTRKKLAAAIAGYRKPQAKPAGAGTIRAFTLDEIAGGIHAGEFEPFFQPKVALATGLICGAEALARWRHPLHGLVSVGGFIAQLESSPAIDALTMAIATQAARECRAWRAAGLDVTVSVNVSLASLADVALADRLTAIIEEQLLDPRHVVLEITETAAASDLGKVLENLSRLRMRGFGLAIDDYGTGYASMQQLARIPFTELKIDQSFVRSAPLESSGRAMLESSLEIARKLDIVAVAEGVESRRQADMLHQLGCPLGQGYFFARPMEAREFLHWALAR
jgi:EAL domain-containing protein (putative c-di-GMP-specific phosphodiesterase class I)